MNPNEPRFFFKSRMSDDDWMRLSLIVQQDNPNLSERDWIINRLTCLCKLLASPVLASGHLSPETQKVSKTLLIPEISFDGTSNLQVLTKFAELKKQTPTQIIQRYIIDQRLLAEELQSIKAQKSQ